MSKIENQKSPLSMYSSEVQKILMVIKLTMFYFVFISIHGKTTEVPIWSNLSGKPFLRENSRKFPPDFSGKFLKKIPKENS
jgi:hypothetical protein